MKIEKIFGWILLAAGIFIIAWGVFNSFNIFTAKQQPPAVFSMIAEETAVSKDISILDLQAQMEKMIGEQLKGILPVDSISNLLNLIAWSVFMGILFFAAGQISGIGIKLIKK
jgi:hypothetical protein